MDLLRPTEDTQSIDDVIHELDEIIAWARQESSVLGYFPSLYRKVTIAVRDAIRAERFDDNARMERLDIVFARRYLDAFNAYRSGQPLSESWIRAFEDAQRSELLILQHLLLGMNAHINLDLGIAAAQVSPGEAIHDLRGDFVRINAILQSLVDEVEQEISKLSPLFWVLDWVGGKTDERIVDFALISARDAAWFEAQRFAAIPPDYHNAQIALLDHRVAGYARYVEGKSPKLRRVCKWISKWESDDVQRNLRVLS